MLYNKHVFDKQLSRSLCFNSVYYVQKKNNLFLARLPGIVANSNENYRRYNFQAFADILNFQKIYNPNSNTFICLNLHAECSTAV